MGVPEVLIIIGIGCAAIEEWTAQGRSIGWWGVILIGVALLWGSLITA
jgi:hypothetical protein